MPALQCLHEEKNPRTFFCGTSATWLLRLRLVDIPLTSHYFVAGEPVPDKPTCSEEGFDHVGHDNGHDFAQNDGDDDHCDRDTENGEGNDQQGLNRVLAEEIEHGCTLLNNWK